LGAHDIGEKAVKAIRRVAAVVLVFAASATGRAEVPGATPDNATFHTRTDLVALNVTVTNRQDKHVAGLQADQFVVTEDGVRQPVEFFAAGSVPLDLSILIDASASMKGKMALARDAAAGLVRSLRSGDRASLVEFRDAVRIRQPLTSDTHAVETALAQIEPRGSTSMYDALYIALKELTRAERAPREVRRQAIVLLSDGDDTASLSSYEDVSELARRAGILIYSASVRSPGEVAREKLANGGRTFDGQGDYCLKALAQDTGGRAFFPKAPAELKGVYERIAEELGSQYALGYVPTNERRDGAWRRVAVQVLAGDARPRTRTGYFALGDASSAANAQR
jgi:Ca-activated chloride channel homolog